MIAYVDASVFLRIAFGEPEQLPEWQTLSQAISSSLVRVESLRTIDRARMAVPLSDEEMVLRRNAIAELLKPTELVELNAVVLERASQPFPTALGTLDAIHLSTALLWQESQQRTLDAFLTHDVELGRGARAMGMRVLGC